MEKTQKENLSFLTEKWPLKLSSWPARVAAPAEPQVRGLIYEAVELLLVGVAELAAESAGRSLSMLVASGRSLSMLVASERGDKGFTPVQTTVICCKPSSNRCITASTCPTAALPTPGQRFCSRSGNHPRLPFPSRASAWAAGLSVGGGGFDSAPPPQKGAQFMGPPKSYQD